MIGEQKIMPEHRCRKAIVYLRQSSSAQVRHNKESQALQYALAGRAKQLGFDDVEVIDTDLGASASMGSKERQGFQRLLGSVALGEVGLVLSREASRLSRTQKDWGQFLELCQLFDTLIGDADTIYDPNTMDDQLILGIKGTLSAVELKVLRLRLVQGRDNKAQRGEYYPLLPPGYVWNEAHEVVKDPNLRIQESVTAVFAKFSETGSIRQTFLWFHDSGLELPVNKPRNGRHRVVFQRPTHAFIGSVLHNPFYAGAYVWGQRPMKTVVTESGAVRRRQASPCPPEKAKVFIRDHHEGYISWSTHQDNLRLMQRNSLRTTQGDAVGAVRSGNGLLAGLLRCGECGRKLHVRYAGRKRVYHRYLCLGTYQSGGRYCLGFGGSTIDRKFAEELLAVLSPLGVKASIAAREKLDSETDGHVEMLRRRVEQLDYETTRAFEQYDEVDPRNRMVAQQLEQRWNTKLGELERARSQLCETEQSRRGATPEERRKLVTLGENFELVWNNPDCSMEIKKKLVRALLEEAVVRESPKGKLEFVLHWKGGVHTSFEIDKPSSPGQNKTAPADLEIIRTMAPHYGDDVLVTVLNRLGRRTAKGNPWNRTRLKGTRSRYGIAGHSRTPENPGVLSLNAAARHCGVSDTTITRLVKAALLPMRQLVACAPWEIQVADLDRDPVRCIIDHLKRTGRLVLDGDALRSQTDLFQRKQGDDNAT